MQTSVSCDANRSIDRLYAGSSPGSGFGNSGAGHLREFHAVVRKFTTLLYSMAFKEMQKTIPRDGDNAVAEGVRGLVGTYLPQTLGGTDASPLSRYVKGGLGNRFGELIDEQT